MNLMGMVNGLNRLDDTNPFSPTAFLLAVKLFDLFNRLYWAESVAVDLNRMSAMAKCSSKTTVQRARDELIQRGVLVIVRKGKKGTPTTYRMNDLSEYGSKNEPYPVPNPVPNPVPYSVPNPVPNPVPIYIQDKENTRQRFEEEEEDEDAFTRERARAREIIAHAYRQCFSADANAAELDRMATIAANTKLTEVCKDAVYHTALASPGNRLAYFATLCADWKDEYIRTPGDLEEHLMYQGFIKNPYGGDVVGYATLAMEARQKRKERYSA